MICKNFGFGEYYFDEEGYKLFTEEFYPESVSTNLTICPKCNSSEIHYYADYFMCFSCKFKTPIKYILIQENGYLARKDKLTGRIDYFHRFLMNKEIMELIKRKGYKAFQLHVHHDNEHINDNQKKNLIILDEEEHKEHHQEIGHNRAFETWCNKKYGDYTEPPMDAEEEFERWQESKNVW